jgi:hypothetical protein
VVERASEQIRLWILLARSDGLVELGNMVRTIRFHPTAGYQEDTSALSPEGNVAFSFFLCGTDGAIFLTYQSGPAVFLPTTVF